MDALEVVVVVDNVSGALPASTEVARRPPAALDPQPDHLLAEHGYSLLLTVERAGSRQSILYDAGWSGHSATQPGVAGIKVNELRAIALSHGLHDLG